MISSSHNIQSGDGKRGFTIVELLVASAVTMVIAVIMIGLISNILSGWTRLSGSLSTGSQARLVLELMAEDLQNSFYEADGNIWLAATVLHDDGVDLGTVGNSQAWSTDQQNVVTRKPLQDSFDFLRLLPDSDGVNNESPAPFDAQTMAWRYGAGGTWLRFFTAAAAASGPGGSSRDQLPRAVAYQIVRRPITTAPDSEIRYMLYRSTVSAENTMETGYHLGHNVLTNPTLFPPTGLYYKPVAGSGTIDDPGPGTPGTITRPRRDAVIANDVIDFGVRFYVRDSVGNLDLVFPVVSKPTLGSPDRHYFAGLLPNGVENPLPDVADIFIRLLTPEGAKLIRNHEALPSGMNPTSTWWEIAEAHSQIFVRRVQLRSSR